MRTNLLIPSFSQETLKTAIEANITAHGGTYIGSGLEMGIELLNSRQTKNMLSALLLLTDGQDNQIHDYSRAMDSLPSDVQCHTFGYGSDHQSGLLVQLAEQGNGGTFTYIVSSIPCSKLIAVQVTVHLCPSRIHTTQWVLLLPLLWPVSLPAWLNDLE